MIDAVQRFESELKAAVGRSSKRPPISLEVAEIVEHFSELYHEELNLGLTPEEAERAAKEKIGETRAIARALLKETPAQIGKTIQIAAVLIWLFFVFSPGLLRQYGYQPASPIGHFIDGWAEFAERGIQCIGVVLAFGIFRAKRLTWAAVITAVVLFPSFHILSLRSSCSSFAEFERVNRLLNTEMLKYQKKVMPCFGPLQQELKQTLKTPTKSRIESFTQLVKKPGYSSLVSLLDQDGEWVFPSSWGEIYTNRFTTLILHRTNSFKEAEIGWKDADKVRAALPQVEDAAKTYLDNGSKNDLYPVTVAENTWKYAKEQFWNLILWTLFGLVLIYILAGLSRLIPLGRRPAA